MKTRTILYRREFRESFPIHLQAQNQGQSAFEHDHNFYEWIFVRKGQGVHLFRGVQTLISQGDFWVIPCGERHAYLSGSRLIIVNVYVHPSLFAWLPPSLPGLEVGNRLFPRTAEKLFPLRATFTLDRLACLDKTLLEMERETVERGPAYQTKLLGLFLALTTDIQRFIREDSSIETATTRDIPADAVSRVIAYLEEHLESTIKMGTLAERIPMNPSQFSRTFRRQTGMRPSAYLQKLRINRACAHLREGSPAIAWIARECGFQDQGHFARVFKKATGTSPRAFRAAHKIS